MMMPPMAPKSMTRLDPILSDSLPQTRMTNIPVEIIARSVRSAWSELKPICVVR